MKRTRWRYLTLVALVAALCLVGVRLGTRRPADPTTSPEVVTGSQSSGPIRLRDVTDQTGIDFQHTDGSSGRRYIVEQMSAGIATFDYDGDGLIDIYFPNGAPLPGAKADKPPRHSLYKNLGGWRFRDVTEEAGVACTAYGLGICVGDYNDDGHPDIYLNNFGPNVLYRNNGNGTFTGVTAEAGVARGDLVGAGACFLDVYGDGVLDLYVGNYIRFDYRKHVPHVIQGFASYPSPLEYPAEPDTLYRNNRDGTFTDISKASGIAAHAGRSMGMICADYDDDGRTDVFVCNDVQPNFLFHNEGSGRFQEVAISSGVAYNGNGEVLANMGVDAGDYDNDGPLDFFTTNYQGQQPVLFRNAGGGLFDDNSANANAGASGFNYVNWGAGFVDLDNDGYRDLFIGNGHTEDNIEQRDPTTSYHNRWIVLRNVGGKFADVSAESGAGLTRKIVARGVAFDDLDNDGDIDVAILSVRERPMILRNMLNEMGSTNHWLQIRLQGVKSNRDGVGARVKVVAGDLVQIDEVHSGRGYQSHWGSRLHFGLGRHGRVDRIEIRWIGGGVDVLENVPVDRLLTITGGDLAPALISQFAVPSLPAYR
jgi:hypothetical protein